MTHYATVEVPLLLARGLAMVAATTATAPAAERFVANCAHPQPGAKALTDAAVAAAVNTATTAAAAAAAAVHADAAKGSTAPSAAPATPAMSPTAVFVAQRLEEVTWVLDQLFPAVGVTWLAQRQQRPGWQLAFDADRGQPLDGGGAHSRHGGRRGQDGHVSGGGGGDDCTCSVSAQLLEAWRQPEALQVVCGQLALQPTHTGD
jgi:uncharacterized membrane protein YgcG